MVITNHAYQRYSERTGKDPLGCRQQLFNELENGHYISTNEVKKYGIRIGYCTENRFIYWFDMVIKENVFALIRGEYVITVFTEHMYNKCTRGSKIS